MPRVSEQYRAARRQEIIEAAARCFVENGFHATSMEDFFAASGLSAGLVYRYFRTKDELIAAIAAETLAQLAASIEAVVRTTPPPPPDEVIARLLDTVDVLDARERITRVAVQVWGEALRTPAIRSRAVEGIARLRAALATLVREGQAAGRIDDRLDPTAAAQALFGLYLGFVVQRALDPTFERGAYESGAQVHTGSIRATPTRRRGARAQPHA